MSCHAGDIRVETGSKQQLNPFMMISVMEKYRAGQGKPRNLSCYHYFGDDTFQRLISKVSSIRWHLKAKLKEGRVEAIWLSGGRRNICREPGAGVCL